MLVLALDTATPAVTAGVLRVDHTDSLELATKVTVDARAHGELLTPHALGTLEEAGASMSELDAIVCGIGPGPFTGLRAGIVTAAALADALGIPAYPVCSLDAIAAVSTMGEPLVVLTDARRKEVYWAAYDGHGNRTDGPHVQRPEELAALAPIGAGDAAYRYAEIVELRAIGARYPTPAGLVAVARDELVAGVTPRPLTPMYLRRPDAKVPAGRKRVSQ